MEAAYQGRMRALLGLYPLPCEQGLQVLRDVLNQDGGQYVIVYGEAVVTRRYSQHTLNRKVR